MTEKRERWQSKDGTEKQDPDGNSRQEVTVVRANLEKVSASRKVREISAEMDAVGTTVKEKTNTWNESCKESVKRETELYKMVEAAVMDEKQEQKEREMLEQLRTKQEAWSKRCNATPDKAQNKSYEVERKLDCVLWEHIEAFDKELGRPQLIMTKLWQMM